MVIVATLVVSLAAALHAGIFIMESIAWTRPAVWKRFGLASQADAETTKPLAYNQGFYNLFLAIGAIVGVVFFAIGWEAAGLALVVFTMASMIAAAVVLVSTGRRYIGAAFIQGTLPLIGLVLILLA
jgi:putative membrane protein